MATYFVLRHLKSDIRLSRQMFPSRMTAEAFLTQVYERPWLYCVDYATWREREEHWDYPPLVWANEKFWEPICGHYAHVSLDDPSQIAFTDCPEKGERDIQTRMKPGRYLKKYFPSLTDKQVAFYAEWFERGSRPSNLTKEVLFARTADEIEHVYTHGPKSCMSHRNFSIHPTRVYAAGDLAVAYLKDTGDKIIARTLCWPDKQVFGRCYPTPCEYDQDGFSSSRESAETRDNLFNLLKGNGWTSVDEDRTTFDGARVAKIYMNESLVMPYIDNGIGVNDGGDHFVLDSKGKYTADLTGGYINDYDDGYEYTCDNCDSRCEDTTEVFTRWDRRPSGRMNWCDACVSNDTFFCQGTREYYYDDGTYSVDVNGEDWEVNYFHHHGFTSAGDALNYPNTQMVLVEGEMFSIAEREAMSIAA